MTPETLHLRLKAQHVSHMNHLLAAGFLVVNASAALMGRHHVMWSILELFVALALIVVMGQHFFGGAEHEHGKISWPEVCAGLFVIFEAYAKTHASRHHTAFVVASYLPGLILLTLGLFESRLPKRFFLTAHADRLEARTSKFSRFEVQWSEVSSFTVKRNTFTIRYSDGTTRGIKLWRLQHSDDVRSWLVAQFQNHTAPANA